MYLFEPKINTYLKIYTNSKLVLSDEKTWIVLFKDWSWQKMVNLEYSSTFKLSWWDDTLVCIKSWNLKDVRRVYSRKCDDNEYKKEIDFSYKDSVWWLVLFDYKVMWNKADIKVTNNYNNKLLWSKKLKVVNPKWLTSTYAYKNEVIDMLKMWVASWINKWYFLENRYLSESDWIAWIENTLDTLKEGVTSQEKLKQINDNLSSLKKERSSKNRSLTREKFLDLSYKYLVFDKSSISASLDYRDLDEELNMKIASIFDEGTTWKDRFWENYYRPGEKITRWEWAFFLAKTIEKNRKIFLTLR